MNFKHLKKQLDAIKSKHDEARGALKAALKTLKEEFFCDDVEQAESLLSEVEEEISKLEKQLKINQREFQSQWGDLLDVE